MADTKWTGKDTKELRDFGIQIITIGHLDANQAKRLSELIGNACERIKELEAALQEIIVESGNIDRDKWPTQQQKCQTIADKALKGYDAK